MPALVEVRTGDDDLEYCETSVVRTVKADSNHAPDFAFGRQLVLVE